MRQYEYIHGHGNGGWTTIPGYRNLQARHEELGSIRIRNSETKEEAVILRKDYDCDPSFTTECQLAAKRLGCVLTAIQPQEFN